MGDIKGFLKIKRKTTQLRPVDERVNDFNEVCIMPQAKDSIEQASRCMDCGTPFCCWGCPLGNYIPEWNDFLFCQQWESAFYLLTATNNFPEITGRICPALCEYSCVLGINDEAVTIKEIELAIIEYAFTHGLIKSKFQKKTTGKKVAIVGSGPAGLACADQLNKAGHQVVVFEKEDKIGGLLRYGIPDFKLEKWILDRRIEILKEEGIVFNTNTEVGKELKIKDLQKKFDAICLSCGCAVARDLNIEGRNLGGIHFALEYLIQANKIVSGKTIPSHKLIDARNKKVVIIGGGDTGADCVGVAHRQGARRVVQIEILPKPPEFRTKAYPWPKYPVLFKTSTSHQEGGIREWSVRTKQFVGENGMVKKLICERLDKDKVIEEFEIEADLVILALGFLHPEHKGLVEELGLRLDNRGNIMTSNNFMSSVPNIFCCGDMRRGQSLVVWAILEGRRAAYHMDVYLTGELKLPFI